MEAQRFSLFLLIAAALVLVNLPEPASGQGPTPKISFEQRTGILVWDVGSAPGFADTDDNLTDLNQECTIADSGIVPNLTQILVKKNKNPIQLNKTAALLLNEIGLIGIDSKMNAVAALKGNGDQPIFLLFPEIHINDPVKPELGALHESLAKDMLKMTTILDRQNIKIVNTTEGPQGSWRAQFNLSPKTLEDRFAQAYKLMATKWIAGGQLIGEIYGDKVTSQYHDSNDLTIKYALTLKAYEMSFDPNGADSRWTRAKDFLLSRFPTRSKMVNVDGYKEFFDQILSLQSEQIKTLNSQFCEARSREMARYTFELAKKSDAKVVYMGFGGLHAHGIIQQLQKYSASWILFSPNF